MAKCLKCGEPVSRGNIQIIHGKRQHRKCPAKVEASHAHSISKSEAIQTNEREKVKTNESNSKLNYPLKSERLIHPECKPYRLFIAPSTLANFERIAAQHKDIDSVFRILVISSDLDLPEREPEAFHDLMELRMDGEK